MNTCYCILSKPKKLYSTKSEPEGMHFFLSLKTPEWNAECDKTL